MKTKAPFAEYDKRHRKDNIQTTLLVVGMCIVFPVLVFSLTNLIYLSLEFLLGLTKTA